jgi:hypothetical protein
MGNSCPSWARRCHDTNPLKLHHLPKIPTLSQKAREGYGIQVHVDRGHLVLEDGIAVDRRYGRLPRVGHGLRRLVVIGSDGMVSLAAS